MPEIKHTFQAGKMNKDLDERLVPNGEYRSAMNIQVRTTDDPDGSGGESGAVQNIKGNCLIGESYFDTWHTSGTPGNPRTSRCVGSVADEKNDKGYFFFATALHPPDWSEISDFNQKRVYVDTIVEQGLNGQTIPVVVDVFGVVDKFSGILAEGNDFTAQGWSTIKTLDGSLYKPGMEIRVVDENGVNVLNESPLIIKAIHDDTILLHQKCTTDLYEVGGKWFVFESERVLNFSPGSFLVDPLDSNSLTTNNHYITGINVIDGMIFWTDNYSEPKKINIARCKAGTNINGINNNYLRPSKLYVKDAVSGTYVDVNTTDFELDYNGSNLANGSGIDSYLREKHITVIRPAPKSPPTLIMKNGIREKTTAFLTNYNFNTVDGLDGEILVGDTFSINDPALYNTNFKKNDVLQLFSDSDNDGVIQTTVLKAKFVSYQTEQGESLIDTLTTTSIIKIIILSGGSVNSNNTSWLIKTILKEKPLFETTFGRFGYRYKYTDGEYSTFSPWSEIAFLPGEFSYKTDDGFNLGMVNTLRELTITNFIPYKKPLDIIAVDILYKATDSPNVYIVETVEKGNSSEWVKFTPDGTSYTNNILTGSLKITSEMLHRTLPSDQILRSWDNVPRFAKAQEIVGSRLLYANYTQGYNMNNVNVDLAQDIVSEEIQNLQPERSIKSIRDYKIGMVFGDKYGRETPVITSSYTVSDVTDEGYTSMTGDVSVPKSLSAHKNSFVVTQSWGDPNYETTPPVIKDGGWIDYVKYYVKETSNEYHNLIMDRWYPSGDERGEGGFNNIWVSFNSADRNKVDEETHLILKNQNGSDSPVFENARYKIIAIENEAPEYIKTKRNSIGLVGELNIDNTFLTLFSSLLTDGGADVNASNSQASQLWTKPSMEIHAATWNNSGVGDSSSQMTIFGREIKGKVELRVVGVCIDGTGTVTGRHEAPWKELVHYNVGENDDGTEVVKLRWKTPWEEEEADFYTMVSDLQQMGTEGYTLATLEYWLEFRESVVENKPEFDGKFFVKIKQDRFTSENVEVNALPIGGSAVTWSQSSMENIYYIKSSYNTGAYIPEESLTTLQQQEGFYQFDWTLDPVPCHNNTCIDGSVDPKGYFYGAFDNWVLPAPHPSGGQSFFNVAGEHTYEAGIGDLADGIGVDWSDLCSDCIPQTSYPDNCTVYWKKSFLEFDLSPMGSCSANYSAMTRDFWIKYLDNTNTGEDNEYSSMFFDECTMAMMNIYPGPDREELGWETAASDYVINYNELPLRGGPNNSTCSGGDGNCYYENKAFSHPINSLDTGQGFVNGVSGATDNTYGTMVLSFVSSNPDRGIGKQPAGFYQLEQVGTVFTFDSDIQNGTKYQTVGVLYRSDPDPQAMGAHVSQTQLNYSGDYSSGEGVPTYPTSNQISGLNQLTANSCGHVGYDNSEANWKARFRHTMWVEFRRLDGTGSLTTLGMDVTDDPRWKARHDGTSVCAQIRILEPTLVASGTEMDYLTQELDNLSNTNGAVFETEPKKDPNLDIYYEASSALPMVLNKDNIFDFAPINSKVTAIRTIRGNENEVTISDRRDNARINNAHFLHDYSEHAIVSILSDDISMVESVDDDGNVAYINADTYGQSFLHRRDFTIGDKLKFKHSDGTVTQAEVKQLYKPILPVDSFSNLISDDIQYGIVSGPKAFEPAGITNPQVVVVDYDGEFNSNNTFSIVKTALASNNPPGELEVGDVIKSIEYTNSEGASVSVTFSQGPDSTAPRGIQILAFTDLNDTYKQIKFSRLDFGHTWNDILDDIYSNTSITIVFQKNFGYYGIDINVWKQPVKLGWSNCFAFGNGLESDRIRDDFNAPMIDNGVKASTTFSGYKRERISSGLIYSGLYNSKSQVNNLNQFNMAEKITKDLNPTYGSIQALKTRDTDVVVFAEDKTLKVLANKDALFNAGGNPELTATDRVLGTAIPYAGDFGISKDPQSLAWDQYRMYFADRQRGAILRLSQDGLTPISEVGMKTWFRDELKKSRSIFGSFDIVGGEYNVTITPPEYISRKSKTLSFSEGGKGWVSFKSFQPDAAISYSGQYVTVKNNKIWRHHSNKSLSGQIIERNSFYGEDPVNSSIEVVFNDAPSTIKSFKTINYEGSQARVDSYTGSIENAYTGNIHFQEADGVIHPAYAITESLSVTNSEHYDLVSKNGWWVPGMYTDSQEGQAFSFKNKEGKWFSKISGLNSNIDNLDTNEFTVQGIGLSSSYEYSGEVIHECISGCLNADYECVDCDDLTLNDQCTNAGGDIVECNSTYCVAGPCIGMSIAILGCTNPDAANYNPEANVNDGSCVYNIIGCMDPENPNYDPMAVISDSSKCVDGVITGCMDPNAINYNPAATQDGVFFDEYNPFLLETVQMFNSCHNNCSCLYSVASGQSNECNCVTNMCADCCTADQTWNPDLEYCVNNDWDQICADDNNFIVDCNSSSCVSGPCSGGGGGESGCIDGGPDCCTADQAWSEYSASCEDIVYGCMDIAAINYMGPQLEYQWPNQSSTGHDNINGITYNGTVPNTGEVVTYHPSYNPANMPCFTLVDQNGVLVPEYHSCCEYHVPPVTSGCTDETACNWAVYDITDNSQCNYCVGCLDALADNYCSSCTEDCIDCCEFDSDVVANYTGCRDENATNFCEECYWDCADDCCNYTITDQDCPEGQSWDIPSQQCIDDEQAGCNCDSNSTHYLDDNSCYGCMDDGFQDWSVSPGTPAEHVNPCAIYNAVSVNDSTSPCTYPFIEYGCTDITALNYNPAATHDDGSCVEVVLGCLDPTMFNYNPEVNSDDGSCEPFVYGCLDSLQQNYNPLANTDDGSCMPFIYGCMDEAAINYNENATHNEKWIWGGDENWDGTSAGILSNYTNEPCDECECTYPESYTMTIENDPGDSEAEISLDTNPWLQDPDTTGLQEDFYETPFE